MEWRCGPNAAGDCVRGCAGTDGPPGRLSGVGEVPSGPRNEDMGARNGPQGTQATPQPITSASGRASYRKTHKDAGCGELRARCLNARPDIQDHVHLFTMSEYLCGQTPRSLLFFAPLVLTSNAQPLRCFGPKHISAKGHPTGSSLLQKVRAGPAVEDPDNLIGAAPRASSGSVHTSS